MLRGSIESAPYASDDYQAQLEAYEVIASMSRKAHCWDSGVAESFFATAKGDELDHHWFLFHSDARRVIGDCIPSAEFGQKSSLS